MLSALVRRGDTLDGIVVSDNRPERLAELEARFPAIRVSERNADAVACGRVLLALHPPVLHAILPELEEAVAADAVVISLAPVLKLRALSELLGGFSRLARLIPNAPSLVGAGWNPVAFHDGLGVAAREDLGHWLDAFGLHPIVPERALEAYAVLTGMGPTYSWFQWQALREIAAAFGLADADADAALRAMLDGAVRTFFDAGLTAAEVMDLVPVKPLAEAEPQISQAYRDALPRIFAKLTGA